MTQPTVGTTPPIRVAEAEEGEVIRVGHDYFFVNVRGAQASISGSNWERVNRLIVVSQVDLGLPAIGPSGLRSLQRSREVRRNRAE